MPSIHNQCTNNGAKVLNFYCHWGPWSANSSICLFYNKEEKVSKQTYMECTYKRLGWSIVHLSISCIKDIEPTTSSESRQDLTCVTSWARTTFDHRQYQRWRRYICWGFNLNFYRWVGYICFVTEVTVGSISTWDMETWWRVVALAREGNDQNIGNGGSNGYRTEIHPLSGLSCLIHVEIHADGFKIVLSIEATSTRFIKIS